MDNYHRLKKIIKKKVRRFLKKPAWQFWLYVQDPRGLQGRRWNLSEILKALLLGCMVGCGNLREIERMTERADGELFKRRVPDTTMYVTARDLDPVDFEEMVLAQIRTLNRSKILTPQGLPCGIIAIDGKTTWTGDYDAVPGFCLKSKTSNGKPYWSLRVLRAVLTSAPSKVCLYQEPIPADSNDMGAFEKFFNNLEQELGIMYEVVTLDSGFTSERNARIINEAQKGYVMGLKDNQPTLLMEAKRIFPNNNLEPEIVTDWEVRGGIRIRRQLYRTLDMEGYMDFPGLRQVWLVRQESYRVKKDQEGHEIKVPGSDTIEDRYFITNMLWNYLTAWQILLVIRNHWGIENDCNWTMDTQWEEDTRAWVTKKNGLLNLAWFRIMAYNLIQILRSRYLTAKGIKRSFSDLFDLVRRALESPRGDIEELPNVI